MGSGRETVTVIVPVYNHARFLPACLDSVLAQTFEDWKLVVIDDISSDDSLAVAQTYGGPKVDVLANAANLGTYGTLQRGVEMAAGEFVAVLNSDDIWRPDKLEKQLARLRANPAARFCFTLGRLIDQDGAPIDGQPHADWPTEPVVELLPWLLRENRILASSVLWRREGLAFHPECRYSGDWVALLEAAAVGPAACVAEPLSDWRIHPKNSHLRSQAQMDEEIWIRESIRSRRWRRTGVKGRDIRLTLAQNELDLAALYVLDGRMMAARAAAVRAVGLGPSTTSVKRLALTGMPAGRARRRLWPDEDSPTGGTSTHPPLEWRT